MRIVFVTPRPPSRAHARSLGFIVNLARRYMITVIALCQTAGDAAALRQLHTLGVETIAIPDGPRSSGGAAPDPLPRARTALKRIVARGDVGLIQIEGSRQGAVAQGLSVPVIWDVVGEADAARQQMPSTGPDEGVFPPLPATGATQPVRAVVPTGPRGAQRADDTASALLSQYASVIVGAERDAISLLGARRALSAPLSARLTDLGALLTSTEPLAQEDDLALRSFPLLRRKNAQRGGKERPATTANLSSTPATQARGLGVTVIPQAIDLDYYTPQAQERGRVGLVVYGELADDATGQGIAWMLREVAPRIWRISPQVNITIVGRSGSALPPGAFEDVQAQLHDERVRLVESIADIRAIVRQAALVIIPTLDGAGAPRAHESALEAMALGTPVVMTQAAFTGLPAVPGRDLLVATSADRLATLTLRVLGDEELWGMLARHGRAYVARRHSWRLASQRLEQVYARALGYPLTGDTDAAALEGDETLLGMATDDEIGESSEGVFTNTVSVMSMLGLVGLATHPLAGAPSSGRLAPRWR